MKLVTLHTDQEYAGMGCGSASTDVGCKQVKLHFWHIVNF